MGKQTAINIKANREMKKWCVANEVTSCERCFGAYCHNWFLTYAHKHKRDYYKGKPVELLWDRSEFRLLGVRCHELIEHDREATLKLFGE